MDRTCRDCRHWQRFDLPTTDSSTEQGVLVGRITGDEYSPYRLEDGETREWGICARSAERDSPMFTADASGYFSSLSTRAGFSCSEFTARDA